MKHQSDLLESLKFKKEETEPCITLTTWDRAGFRQERGIFALVVLQQSRMVFQ